MKKSQAKRIIDAFIAQAVKRAHDAPEGPAKADLEKRVIDLLRSAALEPDDPPPSPPVKRGRGRPPKFKPEYVNIARAMTHVGCAEYEIAQALGVASQTLWSWGKVYPEFYEAIKFRPGDGDERVERSLFHKAIGYTFDTVELFNNQGEIIEHPVKKHIPPDTASAIFWLKNRKPEQWRDRIQMNGHVDHNHRHAHLHAQLGGAGLDLERYTEAQLDAIADFTRALNAPAAAGHDPAGPAPADRAGAGQEGEG